MVDEVMGLNIGPVRPSTTEPEFGPDFTVTPEKDQPATPPKVNQKNPPKPSVFSTLGQNKKLRSPVRKLTIERRNEDELSDLERLEGWYHAIASAAELVHPKFSDAMHRQASGCAIAWFGLAENNDKVRRWILAMIEGGDWGKVFSAHLPIFMAVIPEATLNRLLLRGAELFVKRAQEDDSEQDDNVTPMFPGNWSPA